MLGSSALISSNKAASTSDKRRGSIRATNWSSMLAVVIEGVIVRSMFCFLAGPTNRLRISFSASSIDLAAA